MDLSRDTGQFFAADDYFTVQEQYFSKLIGNPDVRHLAAPNGTDVAAGEIVEAVEPTMQHAASYCNDALITEMDPFKTPILEMLAAWEQSSLSSRNCTVCHSATMASLAVLSVLKDMGIQTVLFETPAFYGTLMQATRLGLHTHRIPTYARDKYDWDLTHCIRPSRASRAIWISHPRASLGTSQPVDRVNALLAQLSANDVLVVDEALESSWPSGLRQLWEHESMGQVIRLRSLFKSTGLNGLRLALILHDPSIKADLDNALWQLQGGLDRPTLDVARQLVSPPDRFAALLNQSTKAVVARRERLQTLCDGTAIKISDATSGYIATGEVLFPDDDPRLYGKRREELLHYLRDTKITTTLGSSLNFALDSSREHFRINLLRPLEELESALSDITRFRASR